MQPISMHRPRKWMLSKMGHAHAVRIRFATGEWRNDVRDEPDLEIVQHQPNAVSR
jgi:hypothetical protein